MLWSMYWLNYLDRNAIALARINTLEEDLNLKEGSSRKFTVSSHILQLTCQRVPNLRVNPLRRLHPRTDPLEHVPHPHAPQPVHGTSVFSQSCVASHTIREPP